MTRRASSVRPCRRYAGGRANAGHTERATNEVRAPHCLSGVTVSAHAGLPLRFEPNRGQTASAVRFLARGPGYTLFLMPTESVMVLPLDQRARERADDAAAVDLRMRLADSNPEAVATGLEPLAGTASYFVGIRRATSYYRWLRASRLRVPVSWGRSALVGEGRVRCPECRP